MSDALRKEIIGVGLAGLFLFTLVSLLSYDPLDPSFNTVAAGGAVRNFCGRAGSYAADFLFQLFGVMSYAVVRRHPDLLRALPKEKGRGHVLPARLRLRPALPLPVGPLADNPGKGPDKGRRHPLLRLPRASCLSGGSSTRFSYFGSLLFSIVLFLISLFLIAQAPLVSIVGARLSRKKPASLPAVRVVEEKEEEKKQEREKERKERRAVQESFEFLKEMGPYKLPPVSLLDAVEKKEVRVDKESAQLNARILEKKLKDYGIEGKVVEVRPGPVITMYEFEPAPGIKVSRIANLSDDLAMALSAVSIRIIAPIPGKAVVGIEIPNKVRQTVYLREIIESDAFAGSKNLLTLALGKTIAGEPFVAELTRMPHLLVAGSTGSGKSVSLNTMICSILFKATPMNVRFMMIDLKMLELSFYDGIPHLLLPVITNAKSAKTALRWLIDEMERRYQVMAEKGVRNIEKYNQKASKEEGEDHPLHRGRHRRAGRPHDGLIEGRGGVYREARPDGARLGHTPDPRDPAALRGRPDGHHQGQFPRPHLLPGDLEGRFPHHTRHERRREPPRGGGHALHEPRISAGPSASTGPSCRKGRSRGSSSSSRARAPPNTTRRYWRSGKRRKTREDMNDEKYEEALTFVYEKGEASISMIQRRFRIGYNRAARIVERMEREGVVGPSTGIKPREVLRRKETLGVRIIRKAERPRT